MSVTLAPAAVDILEVYGLSCAIETPAGVARILQEVTLRLGKGRTLGLVGESGSGKSMLIKSILG
ncbi:ATP-binding cassette domain-containing protein, partial [Enterococcus lactis]|uniref:ATP-binding cassette domain-containing protein n=1 Tax=Enterococcus lactis TaxID=357441 RepID=UPI00390816DC